MATVTEFKEKFPEFESVEDARIQLWLDFAACIVCLDQFSSCSSDWAHCLIAAHYLSLEIAETNSDNPGQPGGVDSLSSISSLAVGDVNTSFDNTKVNTYLQNMPKDAISQELAMTRYGRMFLALLRRFAPLAVTTATAG